jgi:hypothetical protein
MKLLKDIQRLFYFTDEMNLKLDGLERSNAVQELTATFQEIMVSSFRYLSTKGG